MKTREAMTWDSVNDLRATARGLRKHGPGATSTLERYLIYNRAGQIDDLADELSEALEKRDEMRRLE